MFSDAAGTIPALTTNTTDGFAFTVDVNLNGTTTVTNFSSQTSVRAETSGVPEPSSLALVGTAIALLIASSLPQQRQRRIAFGTAFLKRAARRFGEPNNRRDHLVG